MPRVSRVAFRAALVLLACRVAPLSAQGSAPASRVAWPDEGPRTWAPRPTAPAITAADLRTRLYQLADDSMSGRRIGEPGNYKATDYIAREFARLGLKPAGEKGTFFQTLPYGTVGFDRAASRLSVGGAALAPGVDWAPLPASAAAGTGTGAAVRGVPVVFAGDWGDTVALDPAKFRGKVAVFVGGPALPGPRRAAGPILRCDSVPDRFGAAAAIALEAATRAGAAPTPVSRGDARARAAGAAAIFFVQPIDAAAGTEAFRARPGMEPSPAGAAGPGGAVVAPDAAERLFDKPLEQLAVGEAGRPVTASWRAVFRLAPAPARNVVAILPGADPARAGEYVLVSAHNDHVGTNPVGVDHDSLRAVNQVTRRQGANDPVCRPTAAQQQRIDSLIARARSVRPPRRDSIMNGADDDGSGTVILLELAEKFASEHPARSIIFVSHTGEEAGLLGSRWFTDHPTIALDSVAAALNMDMEGKGRAYQVKFGGPNSIQTLGSRRLSREFGDVIDSVNASIAEPMAIDRSWDVPANPLNRFCRSDQVNYVHHDVPITYLSTGYAEDYHQPTDEPQYIDYDHMARIGRFVHEVMWAISERANRPAISGADPSYPRCR
ncbi:MAG TPA: M28 family peptidase [Longimicrobiales bacterium]|nr:M28 family peptidase [Longimicrobiales bacterium]